jgi:hypothetical protein
MCPFCLAEAKEPKTKKSLNSCEICHGSDYLTAEITGDYNGESDLEELGKISLSKKCHLICAIFNPKYKLIRKNPPLFTENQDDQYAEVQDNCTLCKKPVINGIKCGKNCCKEVVHLICALKHRIQALMKNPI